MKTLACRCEDVTLHELEAALDLGYDDIESVKRYTGFGTGWCQGKWCLALCARVIHERGAAVGQPITPRPPYHPVSLAVLAGLGGYDGGTRGVPPNPPDGGTPNPPDPSRNS